MSSVRRVDERGSFSAPEESGPSHPRPSHPRPEPADPYVGLPMLDAISLIDTISVLDSTAVLDSMPESAVPGPHRRRVDRPDPGTVPIVDDEPSNVGLAARWMGKAGYSILTARSGLEALDVMKEDLVDLVLLDVMMPGMDGYAVYNTMLGDPALIEIPVIFVTAHADPEERVRGLRMGAADFLSKPYYGDELLVRVESALRARRQRAVLVDRARHLEEESIKDPLTGLYNRRLLADRLSQEVARAKRFGLVVSCIMIDIDHFKQVNDILGHHNGDVLLQQVACIISHHARSSDFVARYGGEEFVVVLPQTGPRDAFEVAERIRTRTSEITLMDGPRHCRFTVSAGVASFPGGFKYDSDSLLREADRALLKAKASGKNRTVVAGALAAFAHEQAAMTAAGRILIVEDEPNNQVLLQKVLTRMGYEWDCVGNGEEAVARAAADVYGLVLMDLSLPGIDGWQATRTIRESGNVTPIIATSAHAMAEDKALAAAAGCNEYITKPYNLAELRRTIERYVPLDGAGRPDNPP